MIFGSLVHGCAFNCLSEKVTLITPPSIFLLDERVFNSLGILKIASSLEARDVKVEHLDLSGTKNYLDALDVYLEMYNPKIIGITTTTPQLPSVVRIIEKIRDRSPDTKIILGGPHVTLTHSAVKLEKKLSRKSRAHSHFEELSNLVDVLVSGDGEFAIFAAIQKDAPKLIDGDDPKGRFFLSNESFENLPFPARHLVDLNSYHYEIEGHRSTSLIAQLGCPYGCGFCGGRNSKSLRMVRIRSSESIISEIKHLYEQYGYTGFMFYDDELNVNKNMVSLMNQLRDLQDKLGVEFRFRGFVKANLFTEEQATSMYAAGFRWILSGFESGDERILENINKRSTREENLNTIEFARRAGLKVKALMSVGHPGESSTTIESTQKWLMQVKPDDFDCTVITTYPGTPYYDEAIPHDKITGVWTYTHPVTKDRLHSQEVNFLTTSDYYKGDPNGGYKSFVFTDHLTADELVKGRNWIESSVRTALGIPYPKARAAILYEHSVGQGANLLPTQIFSKSTFEKQIQKKARNW